MGRVVGGLARPGGVPRALDRRAAAACRARSRSTLGVEGDWKQIKVEQNPFGFVPFVYIPHIPSNGFFGVPLAEWAGAVDLAEEYNERLANIGDIVRQNSYPFGVLKSHPTGKLKSPFRMWKDGPTVIDLGPGLPGEKAPELDWFDPSEVTAGTMTYLDTSRRNCAWPWRSRRWPWARTRAASAARLTLLARMFPMKSHVAHRALAVDVGDGGSQPHGPADGAKSSAWASWTTWTWRAVTITPNWAPMLPRDRAELVNELVQRAGVGHIHPTDALEQYEDTPTSEVEEAYKRIQEHQEWQAELNKPEPAPGESETQTKAERRKERMIEDTMRSDPDRDADAGDHAIPRRRLRRAGARTGQGDRRAVGVHAGGPQPV